MALVLEQIEPFFQQSESVLQEEKQKIKGKLEERLQNWENIGEMSSDIDALPASAWLVNTPHTTSIQRNCHSSA